MINAVLSELNNYFPNYDYGYTLDASFTSADTIEATFTDTFLAGEWIEIKGTRLNDGVYLISAIYDTSITIDVTYDKVIKTEAETEDVVFRKLDIPDNLVTIVGEIDTYNTSADEGIKSETQGERSITYESGSSWKSVYSGKLDQYRKLRW